MCTCVRVCTCTRQKKKEQCDRNSLVRMKYGNRCDRGQITYRKREDTDVRVEFTVKRGHRVSDCRRRVSVTVLKVDT